MAFPDYPVNNIGREIIPFTIVNQSGYAGQLYYYLVGTTDPLHPENHWYFLSDVNGDVTLCTPTTGETSYSVPIANELTIQLPRLSGMRIYFSFDMPLHVTVGANGIPSAPAGWVKDSNYQTLFDWIELTWEKNETDYTLGGNTTQVDMFGLPFGLMLTGFDATGKPLTENGGFSVNGLRHQILAAMKEAPSPWNNLILDNSATGFDLRAISPYHGMELNLFPRAQLQPYIDLVWETYTLNPLIASAENVTYKGNVVAGEMVFKPENGGPEIAFPRPNSFTVYTSGPVPSRGPSGPAGVIQAAFQAAFLRSTLLLSNHLPECNTDLFYQARPINSYARIFHEYATNSGAYAFGFDDVCSKSSFIIVHNPTAGGVVLLGF